MGSLKTRCRGLWILFLSLWLVSCQQASEISGLASPSLNTVAETTGYEAVVRVVLPLGAGFCTGTFISPRAVLTAAHCTTDPGTYTLLTTFGTYSTRTIHNLGTGDVDDPTDLSLLILSTDVANPNLGQVYPLGEKPEVLETVRVVGFGCNSMEKRTGSGIKRTGTNQIYNINQYLELLTPLTGISDTRGILGPENRAGACFGDSGGPMLRERGNTIEVVGISHAGSWNSEYTLSQYADLNSLDALNFLDFYDDQYDLRLNASCGDCSSNFATTGIMSAVKLFWNWATTLLNSIF